MKLSPEVTTGRDELILEHLGIVRSIAMRAYENLPPHLDLDDLIHAGILGLIDAASKYDNQKGVSFKFYAKHRIRGAILDSLRAMDSQGRAARRQQKVATETIRAVSQKLQREPTEVELAEHLGISLSAWREMAAIQQCGTESPLPVSDEGAAFEIADEATVVPERACADSELRAAVHAAIQQLPDRYQSVITLYYAEERTMSEIGETLGVNESRISQMHKTALQKLGDSLRKQGVQDSHAFEVLGHFRQASAASAGMAA